MSYSALPSAQRRANSARVFSRLLALIAVSFLAIACTKARIVPRSTLVAGIDFSKYMAQGFLFTPEMYDGPYASVGLISVTMSPEAKQVAHPNGGYMVWEIELISTEELVARMHEEAKQMGADAIVNFRIRVVEEALDTFKNRPVFEVSGFAIRRADRSSAGGS